MASGSLKRELALPAAIALVVGQVIAVGIFLTPGTIIRGLASPLLITLVWVLMGAIAICGALVYGALAGRFPQAGGGYVYLRDVYGRRLAFLYGWKCLLIMDPGITAALAMGFSAYAAYMIPIPPAAGRLLAVGAIALLAFVHVLGVRPGARLLTALSALKIALVLGIVLVAFGSHAGDWAHFVPFDDRRAGAPPFWGALAGAFVAVFFTFGGWWEVTKIAGEVRDPARTLPRALWSGLTIVTLLYLATTLAFVYVLPIESVSAGEAFVAQVGQTILGPSGGDAVAAIVVVCVVGSLATMLMVGPRLYVAMAEDGLLVRGIAAVHPRFGTPSRAILIQALLATVLVALGTFESIVSYFVFITVVFIALTVATVFVLKRREPDWHVPGYPWTPAVFLLMAAAVLVLIAANSPLQAVLGCAVVLAGIPVYGVIRAKG
jgi:basic amino acid/polyamine antiporter, APA family